MSAMSDFLESSLVNHLFRATSLAALTTIAVALFTASLTDASTGAASGEVSGGSYARVNLAAGTGNWASTTTTGTTSNSTDITFTTASASWGTITNVMLASTTTAGSGNSYFYGALTASKAVGSGDVFKFNAGDLSVQVDN